MASIFKVSFTTIYGKDKREQVTSNYYGEDITVSAMDAEHAIRKVRKNQMRVWIPAVDDEGNEIIPRQKVNVRDIVVHGVVWQSTVDIL